MLDTNTVSHLIKEHPAVVRHVVAVPMASLCVSAITEGELLFGLAKRPNAKRLHRALGVLAARRRTALGQRRCGALRNCAGRDGASRQDTRAAGSADCHARAEPRCRAGDERPGFRSSSRPACRRLDRQPGKFMRFWTSSHESFDPQAQSAALKACTASTRLRTCSGSMSGDRPWPRLKT